ncbi:hypothetical protein GCK72_019813 [Caenorhabditis remanei]|uniref:SPK domain-containing protein n=1 Tax=Caenorhabditis remanei TaxID=31234 RepID=A0A6A5GDC9_CAERE|nr:hypothetical protein GCK72_019813 [Caenorhabditis remanei]KAF1753257.1 hypothetical protein GCK72_019813 [Caenorhabditis remanei]
MSGKNTSFELENYEETKEWINFIIEKAGKAVAPLNLTQLCETFRKETKSEQSLNFFYNKCYRFRSKIHQLKDVDTDTKVRMIFSLNASIDADFYNELKKDAEVVLDDGRRIVKYRKNGGGLSLLRKIPMQERETERKDEKILSFLAEKSNVVNTTISSISFLKDFKEKTKSPLALSSLETRYRCSKNKIYWSPHYDQATKLKMMFISGAKVPECFLKQLREDGVMVEIDEMNRITNFKLNEELGRDQNVSSSTNDYRAQDVGNVNSTLGSTVGNDEGSDEEMIDDNGRNAILETKAGKISTNNEYDRGAEFDYEDLIQTDGDQKYVKRGLLPKSERFSKKRSLNAGTSSNPEMEDETDMTIDSSHSETVYAIDKKNMIITEELYIVSPDGEDLVEETTESTDSVSRKKQQNPTSSITVHPIIKSDYRVPFNQKPSKELSNSASSSSSEVVKMLIQPKLSMKTERLDKINDNFLQGPRTEKKCEKGFQNTVRAGKLTKSSNIRLDDRQVSTSSFVNSRKKSICVESESIGNPTKTHNQIPTEPPLKVCKVETTSCDLEVIAIVNAGHDGIEGSVESLEGFLKLLRAHVSMLNSRSLDDFEIKIDYLTTTLGDKPISIDNIRVSLETCFLSLAQKGALKSPPGEETKSLRNLMVSLKTITCYFRHSSLNSFKEKLENFINGLFVKDKRITIDEVRSALERALDFVTL